MKEKYSADAKECIRCHKCRKECLFLKKYNIDIGDVEQLNEVAYHCFLCGKCTQVCPKGIDGRSIVLELRESKVEQNGGQLAETGYAMLQKEKQDYIFRNHRHAKGKSVLFPGCSFPSFYPEATKKLVRILRERADIGVMYDCCGKPIAELGLKEQNQNSIEKISAGLAKEGIEEVVMLCPNCYHFLKDKLPVPVVSIYEKLKELGIGEVLREDISVFLPCPDRSTKEIAKDMMPFLKGTVTYMEEAQCCGLGGCATIKEPELSAEMRNLIKCEAKGPIYTYCASCAGNLARIGCEEVEHILVKILGSDEKPDTKKSLWNRAKTRFI